MAFMTMLKDLFGGKKKRLEVEYWQGWDRRIAELEQRIKISNDVRLVTGGLEAFEASCDELMQSLGGQQREGAGEGRDPHVAPLLKRLELARGAARLIRDETGDRERLWKTFLKTLHDARDVVRYRTRVKYDRLRLDHECGRFA